MQFIKEVYKMIRFKTIENNKNTVLINNRYLIYKDCGVVYDTLKAHDIPQYIFKIRDLLLKRW